MQFWTWLHGEREVTVQSGLEWHDPAVGHRPSCSPFATSQPPKLLLCHLPSSWTHCALSLFLPQAEAAFPPLRLTLTQDDPECQVGDKLLLDLAHGVLGCQAASPTVIPHCITCGHCHCESR